MEIGTVEGRHVNTDEFVFPIIHPALDDHGPLFTFEMTTFAFTNAPLLLTAAHYSDLFIHLRTAGEFDPDRFKEIYKGLDKMQLPFIIRNGGGQPTFQQISRLTWDERYDIALLFCHGYFAPTPYFSIEENPHEGMLISQFGLPTKMQELTEENGIAKIRRMIASSQGKITGMFPEGRSKKSRSFAVFESDASIDGGASGGPVFCKGNQRLVGINSSSFGEEPPSYHSWLGKALDVKFSLTGRIDYSDGSSFDLRDFSLRQLHAFAGTKKGLESNGVSI